MIAVCWSAFTFAAACLFGLFWLCQQPSQAETTDPASFWLVGFFLAAFATVAWTCRDTDTRRHS